MPETARQFIEDALMELGVYAPGETVSNDDLAFGLRTLQHMLRHWSAKNIRVYVTVQDTVTLTGAASYTIGSGGDCNTVRPVSIRGGYISGEQTPLKIIDEAHYRRLVLQTLGGSIEYLWYSPEYPLGRIYLLPAGSGTLKIDSLKPLTEPSAVATETTFPLEYDEAIKYNLAIRLAAPFSKEPSMLTLQLAKDGLEDIETRNFAEQMNSASLELIRVTTRFNIDAG